MTHTAPSATRTETTFELPRSPDEVWAALEALRDERIEPAEEGTWWLPGFTCRAVELRSEPGHELVVRKDEEPCRGTTIGFTVEHAASGSRVHVVQSGFDPAFVRHAGDHFWLHADHIWADLELFFRTGALAGRAWRWPTVDLGFDVRSGSQGAEITAVREATWGAEIGLQAGDTLVELAGAPVYDLADVLTVQQTIRREQRIEAAWIRSATVERAAATI